MTNIIIFGDSITRWASDEEKQGRVNRLREKYEETNTTEVYNCGVSGDTTDDLITRFETEAYARARSSTIILLFAIGINDSTLDKGNPLVPLEQFWKNIHTLITQARRLTNTIYFLGLTDIDEEKLNPNPREPNLSLRESERKKYDVQLQTICKEENIPFLPMQGVLEKADLDDGLHPNATGHQKICEKVRENLPKF